MNRGTVTNCYNTGTVSGTTVGGVVGYSNGTVTNCYNTGSVIGTSNVGSVAGYSSGKVINCYYLTGTASGGIEGSEAPGSAEVKTAEEFASGEVAYLLQGEQAEQAWGQDLLSEDKDAFPILTNDSAKAVYKVTFATESNESYAVKYATPTGVSSMPENPTADVGYAFEKWTLDGAEFTADTPVTKNITVYAQWLNYPTYTVTIPASVELGGTAEIKAENVNIVDDYILSVTLSESDFTLKTVDCAELAYTVTNGGNTVGVNDTVLTVAGGIANNTGTTNLAFNLADGEVVKYSGEYTGTVNFTVSVAKEN